MKEDVAVIVVRYEYNADQFIFNIAEIAKYYQCYVFDNSSSRLEAADIESIQNLTYFYEDGNIGLMHGINKCIKSALKDGFFYGIYFDQDSTIDKQLIENLYRSFLETEKQDINIFAIGPQPITHNQEFYRISKCQEIRSDVYSVDELITSGMLMDLKNVEKIGFFDEELFIDIGDFEICWRAKKNGFNSYIDTNITMIHEIGQNMIKIPFKKMPISSPVRNYYQTRNIVYLLTRNILDKNNIKHFLRRIVNVFLNILFVPPRFERLKYNYKGFIDALIGKMGKYQN